MLGSDVARGAVEQPAARPDDIYSSADSLCSIYCCHGIISDPQRIGTLMPPPLLLFLSRVEGPLHTTAPALVVTSESGSPDSFLLSHHVFIFSLFFTKSSLFLLLLFCLITLGRSLKLTGYGPCLNALPKSKADQIQYITCHCFFSAVFILSLPFSPSSISTSRQENIPRQTLKMSNEENGHHKDLPKLKDDGINNNYGEWETKSHHRLEQWDLLKYIEGPTSDPPFIPTLQLPTTHHGLNDENNLVTVRTLGNAAEREQAIQNAQPWLKGNKIALAHIVTAVPGHQLHLVKRATYAKQAWKALQAVYQPRNSFRASSIRGELMTYRCLLEMNVAKWLLDIQRLYNSLCDLDPDRMTDHDFTLTILDLMPQDMAGGNSCQFYGAKSRQRDTWSPYRFCHLHHTNPRRILGSTQGPLSIRLQRLQRQTRISKATQTPTPRRLCGNIKFTCNTSSYG
jgi:hypothetical protein